MLFLWVVYGLWGSPDAYFNQPLYLIDFFVNIAMVYAFFSNVDVLNQLRLFRLLKLPNLLLYVSDSNTLRLFFTMLFESMPSLISVLTMSLAIIFLSAVVGVQLYTGMLFLYHTKVVTYAIGNVLSLQFNLFVKCLIFMFSLASA
jgi:hypothetical protein